jgi:hypothetical protein
MDIILTLKGDVADKLRAEAERQQIELAQLAQDAIATYLDDLDEQVEDTPDEEIFASLREALEDVKAGRTRPIEELFAELDEEFPDADEN